MFAKCRFIDIKNPANLRLAGLMYEMQSIAPLLCFKLIYRLCFIGLTWF
jgi:hypothetical protein